MVGADGGRTKSMTFEPDSRICFQSVAVFRQRKHFGHLVRQMDLRD